MTPSLGGHPGGDVASAVAADAAAATLRVRVGEEERRPRGEDPPESLGDTMARSVLDAHEAVRRHARTHPDLRGMGTTLTALLLDRSGERWAVGHAGDSRAYLLRDGALTRLTRDDTWVQAQVDAGHLPAEEAHMVEEAEILRMLASADDPDAGAAALVDAALERGGVDNVTVVVAFVAG